MKIHACLAYGGVNPVKKKVFMADIVGKLWGFCHTLQHDRIDYGYYIGQLTSLLFLNMIEEKGAEIPTDYSWAVSREKSASEGKKTEAANILGINRKTLAAKIKKYGLH